MRMSYLKNGWVCLFFLSLFNGIPDVVYSMEKEKVTGTGCFPLAGIDRKEAREKAKVLAKEDAVRQHSAWNVAMQGVEGTDVELIEQYVVKYLLKIDQQDPAQTQDGKICFTMHGTINGELIKRHAFRLKEQNETIRLVDSSEANPVSDFDLVITLNHADGQYKEGDKLVVFVKASMPPTLSSTKKVFLLLDYFQSDNTVVHMVPNLFSGQAELEVGKSYTFGGDNDDYDFVITEPFGPERIKGIASNQRFTDQLKTKERQGAGKEYASLQLRGLKVLAKQKTKVPEMKIAVTTKEVHTEGKDQPTGTKASPDLIM